MRDETWRLGWGSFWDWVGTIGKWCGLGGLGGNRGDENGAVSYLAARVLRVSDQATPGLQLVRGTPGEWRRQRNM